MPSFGVAFQPRRIDLADLFGRNAPTVLEIGFGMGETTAQMAVDSPDWNFLGVEVHSPGVGALLKRVEVNGSTNVRVIEHDAKAVVEQMIDDQALAGIHIFFPDPWPKLRHHKRRLVDTQFVTTLAGRLLFGGYLRLATDWPDYAEQMNRVLDSVPRLRTVPPRSGRSPMLRPTTKFEERGRRLGHPITDLIRYISGD